MTRLRALVCGVTLVMALAPLAAYADDPADHAQAELANGEAQYGLAVQQADDLRTQAQDSAANERMIALLRSEAMRERQLSLVSNANAMEQIASALANAARASGDANARNELLIAQNQAAALTANINANLANAEMLAQTQGRQDELFNAKAQADFAQRVANFISGQQAEMNIANAKQIGQEQADAIHTPAIAQQQNGLAIGANELLAADAVLQAGQVSATSSTISGDVAATNVLAHASASLANARAMAANAK